MAGTEHWINVPASWVPNLRAQGFEVRELIVRPSTEQIADKLLADALNVIDAGRPRRRTEAEYLAENPGRRGPERRGPVRPIDGPLATVHRATAPRAARVDYDERPLCKTCAGQGAGNAASNSTVGTLERYDSSDLEALGKEAGASDA